MDVGSACDPSLYSLGSFSVFEYDEAQYDCFATEFPDHDFTINPLGKKKGGKKGGHKGGPKGGKTDTKGGKTDTKGGKTDTKGGKTDTKGGKTEGGKSKLRLLTEE